MTRLLLMVCIDVTDKTIRILLRLPNTYTGRQ